MSGEACLGDETVKKCKTVVTRKVRTVVASGVREGAAMELGGHLGVEQGCLLCNSSLSHASFEGFSGSTFHLYNRKVFKGS